jgi:prolyl-tRNA editing enzyme YbaK/EbsC (Cys-tRNA(Pro) deacylase)
VTSDGAGDAGQLAIEALDAIGLPYEIMACDPELADTAAFCEHYGIPPEQSANCIIVASRSEPRVYCAALVRSCDRLDVNGRVRRLMDVRKVSFASAEDTAALTGMVIGGVTPFGLPADLPCYIDARIMDLDWVIVGGGSRSQKVKVAPQVLAAIPSAEVIDGLSLA